LPRIDPITGVSVMTEGEFWEAEGKIKGTSASEEREKFYNEIAEDSLKVASDFKNEMSSDLSKALEYIISGDDYELNITKVLEIIDTSSEGFFREGKLILKAKVELSDGSQVLVKTTHTSYSGDFYEPPSDEIFTELIK